MVHFAVTTLCSVCLAIEAFSSCKLCEISRRALRENECKEGVCLKDAPGAPLNTSYNTANYDNKSNLGDDSPRRSWGLG